MQVFLFLEDFFSSFNPYRLFVAAGSFYLVAFFVALVSSRRDVFVALALSFGGGCFLPALCSASFSSADQGAYALFLIVGGALLYLLLCAFLSVGEKKKERKKRRAEESRRAVFTLPDRENTFVRDRLNVSLRPEETDADKEDFDAEENKLRLDHVRCMLTKLKAAPLSPGDRLETEEISRLITMYASKEKLSPKEVRGLNDCLSYVLKTAAKYAV